MVLFANCNSSHTSYKTSSLRHKKTGKNYFQSSGRIESICTHIILKPKNISKKAARRKITMANTVKTFSQPRGNHLCPLVKMGGDPE